MKYYLLAADGWPYLISPVTMMAMMGGIAIKIHHKQCIEIRSGHHYMLGGICRIRSAGPVT